MQLNLQTVDSSVIPMQGFDSRIQIFIFASKAHIRTLNFLKMELHLVQSSLQPCNESHHNVHTFYLLIGQVKKTDKGDGHAEVSGCVG